jgi:chlorite dismutase
MQPTGVIMPEQPLTARHGAPVNEAPPTIEGHFVLHDAYRIRWSDWNLLTDERRSTLLEEATSWLAEAPTGLTCLFSQIGQKGEVLLLHYRTTPEDLNRAERAWRNLGLCSYLEPAWSYVSVIEASLYEVSALAQRTVAQLGLTPGSAEYQAALDAELATQRKVLELRVRRSIPAGRYLCFYPMNKRRGEQVNWYALPIEARRDLMRGHGRIGRQYHGLVTQVVCGSMGIDDWEWGVSLHSDDVVAIKRLVTEMRFDPTSALYAEFGPFHLAVRQRSEDLAALMCGQVS